MSALEIVLVSVVGALVAVIGIYILVQSIIQRYMLKKVDEYNLVNKYANTDGIIFLGDSLTEMYPVHEFFPCIPIHNRGISGNTTGQVLERVEKNVIAINPKKVFLWIGTNDLMSIRRNKEIHILKNIKKIADKLLACESKPQVIILSEIPINRKATKLSFLIVGYRKNTVLKKINSLLESYCKENNLPYIDIYTPLLDKNGNLAKEYTLEGLHLSMEGYRVITETIRKYVEN